MVRVVDVRQRRSPLVRGELEILVEVGITMSYMHDVNRKALEEYTRMVNDH